MRRLASMAAAVAGVAVVAYIALPRWNGSDEKIAQETGSGGQKVVAPVTRVVTASPPVSAAAPVVSSEFLAAHRQYSGGIAMQGMVGQVRNVSLEAAR